MSIARIITRGYGSFGSVNRLPTRGYSLTGIFGGQNNQHRYFQQAGQVGIATSQGSMMSTAFNQGSTASEWFDQGSQESDSLEQGSQSATWFVQE